MKIFLTWLSHFIIGTLLLIICEITIISFFYIPYIISESLIWMLIGAIVSPLFFLHFHLTPLYVFGHELTHWLIAKLFRRRTSKFTVHFDSGSVRVVNPNIWITLGPYIFPIYMLLWLAVYGVASFFMTFTPNIRLASSAVVGILYAYLVYMTIVALSHNQPDLQFNGVVFSLVFIFTFNVLFLYLGIAISMQQAIPALKLLWETAYNQFNFLNSKVFSNSPLTLIVFS